MNHFKLAGAVSALALVAAPALAQQTGTVSGGTSGGYDGRNVGVSTYGAGTSTPTGTAIDGGGEATAIDGSASTRTDAKANERRAMQRSVATAQTEDERARSRTRTMVLPNQTVRSKTTTTYKERGSKPVRETTTSVTNPDGTVSTRSK